MKSNICLRDRLCGELRNKLLGRFLGSLLGKEANLRSYALRVFLVLVSGGWDSTAWGNVFVRDARVQENPARPILRSVGILTRVPDDGGWGTAFLVTECHIATAYHVAFPAESNSQRVTPPTHPRQHVSEFQIGLTENDPLRFTRRVKATPVAWGSYDVTWDGLGQDWAILELETCVGAEFGFLDVATKTAQEVLQNRAGVQRLAMLGFPASRYDQPGISVERDCSARALNGDASMQPPKPVPSLLPIDCALEVGASGGPLLMPIKNTQNIEEWFVVGMASREFRPEDRVIPAWNVRHANIAISSSAFIRAIQNLPCKSAACRSR